MKKYYIYTLSKNKTIFYIGKTLNLDKRLSNHKIKYGNDILLEVLDETTNWKSSEIFWIEQFRQWGFKVLNKNNGGGGLLTHSEETKQEMSKIRLGKKHTNHINGLNHGKTGQKDTFKTILNKKKPKPDNFGKNHSLKTKGKPKHTKESKNKISEKMKNHPSLNSKKRSEAISIGNSIPIKQLDLNGNLIKIWKSQAEIQRVLGFPQPNISAACLGKQKTAYKFKWNF